MVRSDMKRKITYIPNQLHLRLEFQVTQKKEVENRKFDNR